MKSQRRILLALAVAVTGHVALAADEPVPDWSKQVAPILQKHCVGCHNADDREGKLSLESFADLLKGGKHGSAVQPGEPKSSRLLLLVSGQAKPVMPPDKDERLSREQIAILTAWVAGGAKGPDGEEPVRRSLIVPKIAAPAGLEKPIASVAVSPDGKRLAVARFSQVEIRDAKSLKLVSELTDFPGKVNSVQFSTDGRFLVTASGITGLYGRAQVWDVKQNRLIRTFEGHRDTMYAAALSPDGSMLATASYDRKIVLWDAASGKQVRTFEGHNGAVFDLAFHPDGTILASASADQTIKLWHVEQGIRLDTLGQPLKEQYVVRFSPDGQHIVAGGLDNRIRVWKVVSRSKPQINPLLFARIAHEGAVIQLGFSSDGSKLVSIADDQSMKVWETETYTQFAGLAKQSDVTSALAMIPGSAAFVVGRSDGSLERYTLDGIKPETSSAETAIATVTAAADRPWQDVQETEPNDSPESAATIRLPAKVKGAIHATVQGAESDTDLFRFAAKAGEVWVFETNAARSKSPLDSKIEILDSEGHPVPRVLLQAVRDSYIQFRGINSDTRDCRVHNWEEMDLNQYLYLNGEVVRLWLWPRGPDSGFQFYPQTGSRRLYFDTTAMSHPLHETCYIVEAHSPGRKLIPNGLPTFTVNYENDDDSRRQLGKDSRLTFTAPADGEYLIRVSDVRSFHGEKFSYELTARPQQPDFSVRLDGANPAINAGNGKEFKVIADRKDGFEGEIHVHIDGLPPGFQVSSPLIIESGQDIAYGTINALPDAEKPTAENAKISKVIATAVINDKEIRKDVNNLGEIKLADASKILVAIGPAYRPLTAASSLIEISRPAFGQANPLELTIAPGETITARVHIQRNKDFNGRVGFEAIAHNLPHGVIVDNVGLSGLLIVEGQTERQFFLTAADWVPEQTRVFHLRSKEEGGQATWPIILHVRKK